MEHHHSIILGLSVDQIIHKYLDWLRIGYIEHHKNAKITSTLDHIYIAREDTAELNETFRENISKALDAHIWRKDAKPKSISAVLKQCCSKLPCCQLIEEFTIPNDDPRECLRGEQGVRVKTDVLRKGTFIGFYDGQLFFLGDFNNFQLQSDDFELAHRINQYAADIDHYDLHYVADRCNILIDDGSNPNSSNETIGYRDKGKMRMYLKFPKSAGLNIFTVAAHDKGNITSLINDPFIYPFDDHKKDQVADANCVLVPVLVGPYPVLGMMLLHDVKEGQELLYAYGCDYWQGIRTSMRILERFKKINQQSTETGAGNTSNNNSNGMDNESETPRKKSKRDSTASEQRIYNTGNQTGLSHEGSVAQTDTIMHRMASMEKKEGNIINHGAAHKKTNNQRFSGQVEDRNGYGIAQNKKSKKHTGGFTARHALAERHNGVTKSVEYYQNGICHINVKDDSDEEVVLVLDNSEMVVEEAGAIDLTKL